MNSERDRIAALEAENADLRRRLAEREHAVLPSSDSLTVLRSIMHDAPAAMFAKDAGGRYMLVNTRWTEFAGVSEADALGRTTEELLPAEVAAPILASEAQVCAAGTPAEVEQHIALPEGPRTFLTYLHPLVDAQGMAAGLWGISRDITTWRGGQTALRESERRYRSLFESSPICLWEEDFSAVKTYIDELRAKGVVDFYSYFREHPAAVDHCADQVIVMDVNQATVEYLGAPDRDALLGPLGKRHGARTREIFRAELCALADGSAVFEGDSVSGEEEGEQSAFSLKVAVASGHEDTWRRVWVAVTDITQRYHAQREARAAAQEAARLTTAHEMIATLQHEINNPLQGVLGFSEYLMSKVDEHHELGSAVQKIFRGAVKIEELVHRLESLVRVESTTYLGRAKMVDLGRSTERTGVVSR